MMIHAYFPPSGGKRWFNCSGSPNAEAKAAEKYGHEPSSSYAVEGNVAHKAGADVLTGWRNPLVGLYQANLDPELRQCLAPYIRAVMEDLEMLESVLYVETNIKSKIDPRLGGTPDAVVISRAEKTATVTDYKHGVGKYVPSDAIQLQIYGILVIDAYGGPEVFNTVILRVVQPRYREGGEVVRETRLDVSDWYQPFKASIIAAINRCDKHPRKFNPGDHCQWCKGAPICQKLGQSIEDIVGTDIASLAPESDEDMETLTKIIASKSVLTKVLKDATSFATRLIEKGHVVPGYTVRESIGDRAWSEDEAKIARALRRQGLDKDLVWNKKLISPAQAEKACKLDEKFTSKFITREKKGMKLAKVKVGEAPAKFETAKETFEKMEMTKAEKALIEEF